MSSTIQTLRGEIMTIRMTRQKLERLESAKHVELEKELLKANEASHKYQKVFAEVQAEHPLLQSPFNFWTK